MKFSLDLKQTQKLTLTKELKQSLDILNMSSIELEEKIIRENEQNPLMDIEKNENIDWNRYINDLSKKSKIVSSVDTSDENYSLENIINYNVTLYDYLKEQISYIKLDTENKKILEYIIDSIDEDGYLRIDIIDIQKDLNVDNDAILKNIKLIHTLDPSGVGARNLEECLLIQIKQLGIDNNVLEKIIGEDLNLLAKKKYKEICKKYKITTEELMEICDIIKKLEPKPGRKFDIHNNTYIVPDVIVEKLGDKFLVRINEKNIPRIHINSFYEEVLKNTKDDEAREYIKEKLNSAITLIKNIESRKNTILKVSNEILNKQLEFFRHGKKHLKPMTLKDVANNLNIHESTVSRAVNGKYIHTPYGLFELKYFFSSHLKENEDIASTSIKNIIKDIISLENKRSPHSDAKICNILKEKNINISRRTVAKYREELGIESSSRRKTF
ncbi:RNA polymerase factor sigma-54 [Alkalithermobacter paradoxus]|uniref:RNA polymerase sigma-54 factor n=1 Tax=Alkalithermobacter paradoxus TaxID=29349 RepID=A0A1V4I984_9FIRM|nr:RNA polymerase sigma-54 factor [[Clostridium] thermoalcaliphilum]